MQDKIDKLLHLATDSPFKNERNVAHAKMVLLMLKTGLKPTGYKKIDIWA